MIDIFYLILGGSVLVGLVCLVVALLMTPEYIFEICLFIIFAVFLLYLLIIWATL